MPRLLASLTKCCRLRSSKRLSVGYATAFSITVVSMMILSKLCFLTTFPTPSCFNGLGQQPFHPFHPHTLTPACQRRRVDRRFVLKVGLATEQLPIRVLHPASDEFLIRTGKRCAGGRAGRPPARRRRRASCLRRKERRPTRFENRPVDQIRQLHQRMLQVDQFHQRLLEQIARQRMFAFGPIKNSRKFARNQALIISFPANFSSKPDN